MTGQPQRGAPALDQQVGRCSPSTWSMMMEVNDSYAPATAAQVTRDVNLIARNLTCHGHAKATLETADHIRWFWAPQLRDVLLAEADKHPERFCKVAKAAIVLLKRGARCHETSL